MMCGQKCSTICSTRTECDILCSTQTCVDAVWFGLVRLRVFVVFLLRKLFFLGQHCGAPCASDCRGCSGSLFVGSLFECLHLVMHWSDCHDQQRTIVLQTILVMNMFSSLVPRTRMFMFVCLERPRTKPLHRLCCGCCSVCSFSSLIRTPYPARLSPWKRRAPT